ncbi:hypothetical protein D3C76_1770780 [compost metagenome]
MYKVNNGGTKIVPIINGMDLINIGFKQSKEIGNSLKYAFKLQLDGLSKEEILKKIELNRKNIYN